MKQMPSVENKREAGINEEKIFERLSWWFNFIKKIEIRPKGISFTTINSGNNFYAWKEVKEITLRRVREDEENGEPADEDAKSLTIRTSDGKKYKIGIGQDSLSRELILEIKKYVKVKSISIKRELTVITALAAVFIISTAALGINAGWDWNEIAFIMMFIAAIYYFFYRRA